MVKQPVFLLGRVPRIVVTIARSLHNYGIPVDVGTWEGPRLHSRAIRHSIRLPDPQESRAEFVAFVRSLVRQHGHDLLIPTDDESLAAVTENYVDLKEFVGLSCPPPQVTRLVLNKFSTLQIAQQGGIRVPKTIVISNSAELLEHARTVPFPWILKPAAKLQQAAEIKSRRISSREEIATYFRDNIRFAPPMLLQECCAGEGVGVEALIHGGECRAIFQHRRLKEFPHDGGAAVIAIAEAPDPELVESSLSLLKALQWEGVAMVEYKVANGDAVLMEVNGRFWGSLSLPVMAGIDFPLYQWKLLHGEPVTIPASYKTGARWRWTGGYLKRMHGLLRIARRSSAARKTFLTDLWQIPHDFGLGIRDPLLSFADPLPAACDALATGKDLLRYVSDDLQGFARQRGARSWAR